MGTVQKRVTLKAEMTPLAEMTWQSHPCHHSASLLTMLIFVIISIISALK